jgi:hypothetical protein
MILVLRPFNCIHSTAFLIKAAAPMRLTIFPQLVSGIEPDAISASQYRTTTTNDRHHHQQQTTRAGTDAMAVRYDANVFARGLPTGWNPSGDLPGLAGLCP